jgi:hypothetical protein
MGGAGERGGLLLLLPFFFKKSSSKKNLLLLLFKLLLLLRAFKDAGGRAVRGLWRSLRDRFRPIKGQIPTYKGTDSDL